MVNDAFYLYDYVLFDEMFYLMMRFILIYLKALFI